VLDKNMLARLLKYSSVGFSTFILDLGLLFILTDIFNLLRPVCQLVFFNGFFD